MPTNISDVVSEILSKYNVTDELLIAFRDWLESTSTIYLNFESVAVAYNFEDNELNLNLKRPLIEMVQEVIDENDADQVPETKALLQQCLALFDKLEMPPVRD